MKKVIILLAAVILASCELIPEIEGPYPADDTASLSKDGEQLFNTRGGEDQYPAERQDSAENQLPLFMEEQARETMPAELDMTEPDAPEELAEAYYPEQAPNEEAAALPLDEPLVQLPPEAPVVQPAPPAEPPSVAASPQRETPPAALPRAEPAVTPLPQPETPPAEPPAEEVLPEETQQEEVPPQPEREPYTPSIPTMPFQPETAAPALTENELPYSRTVRAVVGQYIEIPFRGPGWVYLGEFGSRRGVRYDSRRMDPDGMTFVFRADTEGTYSLKFNRQDFVRDYILNDYVRVIVEKPPAMTGSSWSYSQVGPDRVYASPRWPLPADPEARGARQPNTAREGTQAPASQESPTVPQTPASQVSSNPQSAPAADPVRPGTAENTEVPRAQESAAASGAPDGSVPPAGTTPAAATDPAQISATEAVPQIEDWLKKAWDEYNAGRIPGALEALDQFMIRFPGGSDEAYWLYGQSLEANNEGTRDIRLALDYYRRLTNEFPQSSRYDEARRRIAYLERFYFSIQ